MHTPLTLDPGFSTEELREVFSPESTVEAILEFEAALAMALADSGIAPRAEAETVASSCRREVADAESVLAATWEIGTPLIALQEAITRLIGDEAARQWFHYGATTQDAIDTGRMLQFGRALDSIDRQLASIASRLRELTVEYRHQPHMGRTFLQEARPMTFGFRTATWLDTVLAHVTELRRQRGLLAVQLGGPVGTRDAYGDAADAVVSSVADRLGLVLPRVSWHSDRTRVLALAQAVARVAATMGKIGSDLALLASSAVGEITVRFGGSSSMPEKQNPLDAIRAAAAARACIGAVAMVHGGTGHELDRGIGGWHAEWMGVPLVFHTAGAAVEAIDVSFTSLGVDRDRMASNAGDERVGTGSAQIERVLADYERILD